MAKNDGGPAAKKTLRDYFAAKVMQGICANEVLCRRSGQHAAIYQLENADGQLVRLAFRTADAMLAEREKEPK